MSRIPRFHLVLVLAAILIFVSVPFAGARPLQAPQAIQQSDGGWLGAVIAWLRVLVDPRPAFDKSKPSPDADAGDDNVTPTGGSCIDPTGTPRPWCQ